MRKRRGGGGGRGGGGEEEEEEEEEEEWLCAPLSCSGCNLGYLVTAAVT
jgi:hypothetical protein